MPVTDEVREVLTLYQSRKKTAATKYTAMINKASHDGRLRGLFAYHHATTGRWSSRGINFQNLNRPTVEDPNDYIEHFPECDHEDPMGVVTSALRGMIKAPYGYRLLDVDYSQIEARILAFIAGQQDLVDAFWEGVEVYQRQADLMGEDRQIGKVAVLALGYGGGPGAFVSMAEVYGIKSPPTTSVKRWVKSYRKTNAEIVRFWYLCTDAAIKAVRKRDTVVRVNDYISFHANEQVLRCRLPSGRLLHYWQPRIREGKFGHPQVEFSGMNDKAQWVRQRLWHGLVVENIVQAIAADIMRYAMVNLDDEGYNIIMHVHDQIVCEEDELSLDDMIEIMCWEIPWFEGFPVAADGKELIRFEK